ncbi:MAG: hypothetical protein KDA51_07695, partial [Planctomycetales bacterium]|nr:hypothetical protein [Planctomycetales bacterium]
MQDSAASTAVDDVSSNANDGALEGGPNTADISITGPNSYLTNALDLDGTDDNILLPDVAALKTNEFTVLGFCKPTTGSNPVWGWGPTSTSYPGVYAEWGSGRAIVYLGASNYRIYNNTTNADDGSWHHVGFGSPGGANTDINNCVFMIDGVEPTIDSTLSSGAIATKNRPRIGRTRSADAFDGPIAGVAYFSRLLSDAEIGEHESGPEPINSVAPVVSGTETVGASLSCTSGTWGLDAPFSGGINGTITYTYQWTRSDDGTGTNEADISGATSS